MADIVALMGLEWLYDVVEKRWGGRAAVLVTITLAITILGVLIWVLVRLSGR